MNDQRNAAWLVFFIYVCVLIAMIGFGCWISGGVK